MKREGSAKEPILRLPIFEKKGLKEARFKHCHVMGICMVFVTFYHDLIDYALTETCINWVILTPRNFQQ